MGRTACTELQCLYKGDLYLFLQLKRVYYIIQNVCVFVCVCARALGGNVLILSTTALGNTACSLHKIHLSLRNSRLLEIFISVTNT
jgi:hypothetical protein